MTLFLAGLAVLAMAAVLSVVGGRRAGPPLFVVTVVTGAALVAVAALQVLLGGAGWELAWPSRLPGGDWRLGLDALSAFFALVIVLAGSCAAIYGVGYFAGAARAGAVRLAHAAVAFLLVALLLVVSARSAVTFLVAWELMALLAFALVMFEFEHAATRRAGFIYLAATHAATLALIAMFVAWGGPGDLSFAALRDATLQPAFPRALVLVLALGGFGVKAGIVPLHFWLPEAHAAAPSHVSALMSGLVIKTGIYGLLRMLLLAGGAPAWFGWLVLLLGITSGVLGVVWALAQHDLKRLLAYHSVENIGIILIGMGAGIIGAAAGLPAVSALGFAGALLHVLNHALFKSLLFLAGGWVARVTGTRDIDALGGLARRLPVTATLFLLASAAIVGLPPLNGFVSEWTVARALAAGATAPGAQRAIVFVLAGLGLIGGLALACFAKVNGVVFLGRARRELPAVTDGGLIVVVPMAVLGVACIALGVAPSIGLGLAGAAAGGTPIVMQGAGTLSWLTAGLGAALVLAWFVQRLLVGRRARITADTWSCAFPALTPRMQYTASSFAEPVLEPFGRLTGVDEAPAPGPFTRHAADPVLDGALHPAWIRLRAVADRLSVAWTSRLHVALLWVLGTVLALVLYLALRGAA